jgi:hypothetical protein
VTPAPVLPLPQLPQIPLLGSLTSPLAPTADSTTTAGPTTMSASAGSTSQGDTLAATVTNVLNGSGLSG